jgi:hypothetical protein
MSTEMGGAIPLGGMIRMSVVSSYPKYLYPLSNRRVQEMCRRGVFKTATKLGIGKNSPWYVSAAEVLTYKANRKAELMNQY